MNFFKEAIFRTDPWVEFQSGDDWAVLPIANFIGDCGDSAGGGWMMLGCLFWLSFVFELRVVGV